MDYLPVIDRIGGGQIRIVQVSIQGKIVKVRSRGGLFKSDIRIVIDGKYSGRILIPFWANVLVHTAIKNGNYNIAYHDQKNLIYQMHGDVYGALRYTYHLLEERYGLTFHHGERGELTEAIKLLKDYNDAVVNLRKDTASKLATELFEKAGLILQQIGTDPRNEYKRSARDLTISLASVFDSSGKVNQTVKMAKSIAVQNRVVNRMVNIAQIEPHIISRRQILQVVIQQMELYWLGVFDFLSKLFTENGEYKFGRLISLLSKKENRNAIINRLAFYSGKLGQYDIIPFSYTDKYVGRELLVAKQAIEKNQFSIAIDQLRKSWNSLKLRQIRTELEEVLTPLTCSLFGKIKTVDTVVNDRAIYLCSRKIEALGKVSEIGFVRPVSERCIILLRATISELIKKDIKSTEKARQYLKRPLFSYEQTRIL